MTASRELKRRLLRHAVADNVATRSGVPTAAPGAHGTDAFGRSRRRLAPWLAGLALGLTVAALLVLRPLGAPRTASAGAEGDTGAASAEASAASSAAESARMTTVAAATAGPTPTFSPPTPLGDGVLPLAVRRVVIDPGHGGDDLGTGTARGRGREDIVEKDLTLDIARRLAARLEAGGFEAVLTREVDRTLSLRERARLANESQADVFVSIHLNWLVTRNVRGVETYYLGPTEDPELNALARRENQESGYSLADMRRLLEGIYADVRQEQSRRLASRVQRALYRSLLPTNPTLRDRGVKKAPFVVLVATEMPAILAEVSCLSHREEAELLARPRYREHIAEALFQGIQGYAHDVNQTEEKGS